MSEFKLRDYQLDKAIEIEPFLRDKGIAYLVGEPRTGKTHISLYLCNKLKSKKVLFITKKKAMSSIVLDYNTAGYTYDLIVINYESLHKVDTSSVDVVITDESHGFGSFPKPSVNCKKVKEVFLKNRSAYHILLSGTPAAETHSSFYHQFWVNPRSPFSNYISFYKWAKDFVDVKQVRIGAFMVNDYKDAIESKIRESLSPYLFILTQKDSGFEASVEDHIVEVPMLPITYTLVKTLMKDRVIEGSDHVILADTGVRLQQLCHQLYSGTVKFDDGSRKVLDYSKAEFIHNKFKSNKIAIFYVFIAEREAIINVYGKDNVTDSLEEFNATGKSYVGQVVSSKEGLNLSKAEFLVMYNIMFSSTNYWQSRERLSTMNRQKTDVYWIFAEKGIEHKIFKSVMKKKSYTLNLFKKDYAIRK